MYYFWETRPKISKSENNLEILNEIVLLLIGYTLILQTDFVILIEAKQEVGWRSVNLTITILVINVGNLVYENILTLIYSCKKKRRDKKFQKLHKQLTFNSLKTSKRVPGSAVNLHRSMKPQNYNIYKNHLAYKPEKFNVSKNRDVVIHKLRS